MRRTDARTGSAVSNVHVTHGSLFPHYLIRQAVLCVVCMYLYIYSLNILYLILWPRLILTSFTFNLINQVERDAGIIFLGDFWHVRGSLEVELLNRVLQSLRQWTVPVVMIPGNHDQVTLGQRRSRIGREIISYQKTYFHFVGIQSSLL